MNAKHARVGFPPLPLQSSWHNACSCSGRRVSANIPFITLVVLWLQKLL
jgi:hypothetical protein